MSLHFYFVCEAHLSSKCLPRSRYSRYTPSSNQSLEMDTEILLMYRRKSYLHGQKRRLQTTCLFLSGQESGKRLPVNGIASEVATSQLPVPHPRVLSSLLSQPDGHEQYILKSNSQCSRIRFEQNITNEQPRIGIKRLETKAMHNSLFTSLVHVLGSLPREQGTQEPNKKT